MLTLSRRFGETIHIGGNITITVVDVRGDGKVRIGIDAPKDIPVHRGEVLAALQAAGQIMPDLVRAPRSLGFQPVERSLGFQPGDNPDNPDNTAHNTDAQRSDNTDAEPQQ